MHERDAIEPAKRASSFEFVDPRALGGRDRAADRQFHDDLMAAVAKNGAAPASPRPSCLA